jgi:hypothetical protein
VQAPHLETALVPPVDLGLQRGEVDVEALRVHELEDEGPPLAEHPHVDVLAAGAVELVLAGLERAPRDPPDELLDGIARQLAEPFAALAAAPAARMPLALGAEEDGLREVTAELPVPTFDEDLRARQPGLLGVAHRTSALRMETLGSRATGRIERPCRPVCGIAGPERIAPVRTRQARGSPASALPAASPRPLESARPPPRDAPILFKIPWLDFPIRSFGVMLAIGFLVAPGSSAGSRALRRRPEGRSARYSRITVWVLVGVVIGARLMYVIVEMARGSPSATSSARTR